VQPSLAIIYTYLFNLRIVEFSNILTQTAANYSLSHKKTSQTFSTNLNKNYQILIIFGTNIPETTVHQITVQFPTSPIVCFCTTWGMQNQQIITFTQCGIIT